MHQLDIFSALRLGTEGIDIEFICVHGGMSGGFWESFFAMANTQIGVIVLGVARGRPFHAALW